MQRLEHRRRTRRPGTWSTGRLVAALALPALALAAVPHAAHAPSVSLRARAAAAVARPSLFRIVLAPTSVSSGVTGVAALNPARSPFGLALDRDGHVIWDVELSAERLPAPASLGPYATYVAWIATPNLESAQRLGPVAEGKPATGQVALNKFLVLVSAEKSPKGARWAGPVVLRGFSPSSLLENFSSKTMFNGGMPP